MKKYLLFFRVNLLVCLLLVNFNILSAIAGQEGSAAEPRINHREGIDYASERRFKEAKEWFENNLKVNKSDATSLSSVGVINDLTQGKISEEYAKSFFKSINFLQDGEIKQGVEELSKTIEMDPKYSRAYNVIGAAYASLGETAKAEVNFKKAIEINPEYSEAYFNLAALSQFLEQPEEALKYYKKTLEFNPGSIDALINIAAIYASLEKFKEAIGYYQAAIKIDNSNPEAYYNLALVYFMQGEAFKFKDNLFKAQELYKKNGDQQGLQKVAEYFSFTYGFVRFEREYYPWNHGSPYGLQPCRRRFKLCP